MGLSRLSRGGEGVTAHKAKEFLKNKNKDIKEIANELGYTHPNNFSSIFKKLTGRSPSGLRSKTN